MGTTTVQRLVAQIIMLTLAATSIGGDYVQECPTSCFCDETRTIVDCSSAALRRVPKLPTTAVTVILDNNEFTQINNKSFKGMKNLRTLSINDNRITMLKKDDFVGLTRLHSLHLAGNKLDLLDENVFERLQKIADLDLSRNEFKQIPDHSLSRCSHLQTLNMSGNAITSAVFGPGFTGTRALQAVDLSRNNLGVLDAHSFTPMNHFTDTFSLNLSFSGIIDMQAGMFHNAQGMYRLDLSGNPLIPKNTLKTVLKELELSSIKVLKLSNMNITDVHSIFNHLDLSQLETLDLSNNAITVVPKRTFFKLRQLTMLDLSRNVMTSVGDYSGIGRLHHLRLSHNMIREIDYTSFEVCEQLTTLHIDHNELENIEDAPFENMYDLRELDISHNKIGQFEITSAFEYLRVLRVSANRLQSLGAITRLKQIEELDISGNMLTRLDKDLFVRGRVLTNVNFSSNIIREIESDTFRWHTPQLIDLSHNKLTNIDNLGWTIAREIHLQGNYIQTVTSRSLLGLKWLKYLNLSNNTISTIESDGFRDLRQMEVLDLSMNDLGDQLSEPSARELFNNRTLGVRYINLAKNKITTLDKDIFSNVSSLVTLNLSGNKLSSVSGMWLQNVESIKTLNLSYNHITTIDPKVFDALHVLTVLDVTGNPFTCNCDLADFRSWVDTSSVTMAHFYTEGYYRCAGPYSWKGIDLLHFQVHDNCRDPVDKRIILVVIGCTAFAIFLIAGIIFYQHRWRIKRKLARSQDYRAIYDNNGTGVTTATMSTMNPTTPRHYGGKDWL